MKKFIIQVVLLLIVTAGALLVFRSNPDISNLPIISEQPLFKKVEIKGTQIQVEVADTQDKRNKGLGGRQKLGENEGMLFIFPQPTKPSFWMKGLTFPLDFIWIKDNTVVDLDQNIKPPSSGQSNELLPIFEPSTEIDKVLEVNAGTIQKLDIQIGDKVKLE